ncbi:MAG: hypothetical protein KBF89_03040 [Acidimicrobiia bacterium]|nr:hypothetical protein [Acidimicrobiia bacterium]
MSFDSNKLTDIRKVVAAQSKIEKELFAKYLSKDLKGKPIFPKGYRPITETIFIDDYREPGAGHKTIGIKVEGVAARFIVNATLSDNARGRKNSDTKLRQAGLVIENDPAKFRNKVTRRLNDSFLDLGDVQQMVNLIGQLPKVDIPVSHINGIEVPGFNFGIEVVLDLDERELLLERYSSQVYGNGALVQASLSREGTLAPETVLQLRKEIIDSIGLEFSGDFEKMRSKWMELNRDAFDRYMEMCDTLCERNGIDICLPTFESLVDTKNLNRMVAVD